MIFKPRLTPSHRNEDKTRNSNFSGLPNYQREAIPPLRREEWIHTNHQDQLISSTMRTELLSFPSSLSQQVQKSKLKTFLYHLNRTQIPYQKCYLIKACSGATVIYGYEKRITSFLGKKYISRQQIKKYHLVINEYDNYDYEFTSKYEPRYSASLNLPRLSFI